MSSADDGAEGHAVGRAGFLGGLLFFISLVALSIVGVGHARTLEGAANPQYWIVVLIAGAAMTAVSVALSRASARTPAGETARKAGVALATIWIAVFLWETASVGTGAFAGPFELAWAAWKG
ncbi:hypothetical protein IHQ68_17740 [Chelatococcus sambhunathii]|uniref:Tripartite tricarboxylate transporter TctB family n=1 Tax=Chelatococcus sambhunathii TaxID=363953 RepID=A0ABU1DKQ8_9HYPH|nr:hypothetical protein [Chelatococcus sambhunathii]MDR4308465.1 hypothetical protein [Chelatococcus sambhunathii]